jgi:hypothetical protein
MRSNCATLVVFLSYLKQERGRTSLETITRDDGGSFVEPEQDRGMQSEEGEGAGRRGGYWPRKTPPEPLTFSYAGALGAITVEPFPHGRGGNGSQKTIAGSAEKEHMYSDNGEVLHPAKFLSPAVERQL